MTMRTIFESYLSASYYYTAAPRMGCGEDRVPGKLVVLKNTKRVSHPASLRPSHEGRGERG